MEKLLPFIAYVGVFLGVFLILFLMCGIASLISFLLTKIFGPKKYGFSDERDYITEALIIMVLLLGLFIFLAQ